MPKGKPPLTQSEIDLLRRWIAEGAKNDTPANAVAAYDAAHPPIYTRPPVIASLDYSPDGTLLAVAGFHEVLLHKADGSGLVARLVGLSERVQTVRFSPDGKRLAVAAGQPARMGEVQIWDVEKRKLLISSAVTYDTVYGVSWSPDGKFVAFGCSDKTLRAIDASTGKLVLQQGSHNDWVLDTVFSTNGSHIISVGRDMSAKLTETATQRFVDNITSITPGALRGGLQAVARHPTRDEVLVGGADGVPQIYRAFRQTARKVGDNTSFHRRKPTQRRGRTRLDPSNPGYHNKAGRNQLRLDQTASAAAEFENALAADPRHADSLFNLGKIASAAGNTREAVSLLERAVASDPKNVEAHYQLSLGYRRLGDLVKAAETMQRFRELKGRQ